MDERNDDITEVGGPVAGAIGGPILSADIFTNLMMRIKVSKQKGVK